jgi:hypothetical protein
MISTQANHFRSRGILLSPSSRKSKTSGQAPQRPKRRFLISMRQKHFLSLAVSTWTVVAILALLALAATLASADSAQGYDN